MTIFLCYRNADQIEGRGPMLPMLEHGYFESEDAAWESLRGMGGIMGRFPKDGDWRTAKLGDFNVHAVERAAHPKMYDLPQKGDILREGIVQFSRRLHARHCVLFLLYAGSSTPFTVAQYDIKADLMVDSRDHVFLSDAMKDYETRELS
jgi:hypothetical protein